MATTGAGLATVGLVRCTAGAGRAAAVTRTTTGAEVVVVGRGVARGRLVEVFRATRVVAMRAVGAGLAGWFIAGSVLLVARPSGAAALTGVAGRAARRDAETTVVRRDERAAVDRGADVVPGVEFPSLAVAAAGVLATAASALAAVRRSAARDAAPAVIATVMTAIPPSAAAPVIRRARRAGCGRDRRAVATARAVEPGSGASPAAARISGSMARAWAGRGRFGRTSTWFTGGAPSCVGTGGSARHTIVMMREPR